MDELYALLSRLTDQDDEIVRQLYAILYRYLEKRDRCGSSPTSYRECAVKLLIRATEEQAGYYWSFLRGMME